MQEGTEAGTCRQREAKELLAERGLKMMFSGMDLRMRRKLSER